MKLSFLVILSLSTVRSSNNLIDSQYALFNNRGNSQSPQTSYSLLFEPGFQVFQTPSVPFKAKRITMPNPSSISIYPLNPGNVQSYAIPSEQNLQCISERSEFLHSVATPVIYGLIQPSYYPNLDITINAGLKNEYPEELTNETLEKTDVLDFKGLVLNSLKFLENFSDLSRSDLTENEEFITEIWNSALKKVEAVKRIFSKKKVLGDTDHLKPLQTSFIAVQRILMAEGYDISEFPQIMNNIRTAIRKLIFLGINESMYLSHKEYYLFLSHFTLNYFDKADEHRRRMLAGELSGEEYIPKKCSRNYLPQKKKKSALLKSKFLIKPTRISSFNSNQLKRESFKINILSPPTTYASNNDSSNGLFTQSSSSFTTFDEFQLAHSNQDSFNVIEKDEIPKTSLDSNDDNSLSITLTQPASLLSPVPPNVATLTSKNAFSAVDDFWQNADIYDCFTDFSDSLDDFFPKR